MYRTSNKTQNNSMKKFLTALFTFISFLTYSQNQQKFVVEVDNMKNGQKEYIDPFFIDTIFIIDEYVVETSEDNWSQVPNFHKKYFVEKPTIVELYKIEIFDTLRLDTIECEYIKKFNSETRKFIILDSICRDYRLELKEEFLTKINFNNVSSELTLPNVYTGKMITEPAIKDIENILKNYKHIKFVQFDRVFGSWYDAPLDTIPIVCEICELNKLFQEKSAED